jgi:hypothetical protein
MPSYGSPRITFRLPAVQRRKVEEIAKLYGEPTATFCRSVIVAICSGDMETIWAFQSRLQKGMTEQLALELGEAKKRRKRRRRVSSG